MNFRFFDRFTKRDPAPTVVGTAETPAVVQIDVTSLSRVFSAPMWLRDLGLLAWFLVGVALLLVGLTWLLAITSTITIPVAARGDPRHGRRSARHEDAAPPDPATRGRRDRPPRHRGDHRPHRAHGLRRALRAVVGDQGRRFRGGRQDPGLDQRHRGGRHVEHRRRCAELDRADGEDAAAGDRERNRGADVARVLPHLQCLRDVLPAEGRSDGASLRRSSPGRPAGGRDGDHRERHAFAPSLLPRGHVRRGVQRDRRRPRRRHPRRSTRGDDRRRRVRHRVHPLYRRIHLGRVRRDTHGSPPKARRTRSSCSWS